MDCAPSGRDGVVPLGQANLPSRGDWGRGAPQIHRNYLAQKRENERGLFVSSQTTSSETDTVFCLS